MNFFKLVNIWQSYKQERDCFAHFLRLLAVCWPSAQVHGGIFDIHLTATLPGNLSVKKNYDIIKSVKN